MATESRQRVYLARIEHALGVATEIARQYAPGTFHVRDRGGRDVITEVDRRISDVLRTNLLAPGEGWLSEEDPDDQSRLSQGIVWVVDPLDGTREFVDGIPEWCISVGLVENRVAVAGGTSNPATNEVVLGALECGVTYNGQLCRTTERKSLEGAMVLASRSEWKRGEWQSFADRKFTVKPMGSVAYKLSLVAAGLADATWTLSPKHEWDIAAGVALVAAAGGWVQRTDDADLCFNASHPLLPGLIASGTNLRTEIVRLLANNGISGQADPAV
ncbi:MAG TPA: inositol monophosphatase family protein [Candidatus Angelobacter sp.]|nr:inositol monophosphatase family protein [Candidatus Angelobacter sp.]